jgi:hypothetical protein
VWLDSQAKVCSVLHGDQTGMGPGVIMLQDWPDSGNSVLHLCQHRDVLVRVDCLPGFQEMQEYYAFHLTC